MPIHEYTDNCRDGLVYWYIRYWLCHIRGRKFCRLYQSQFHTRLP